MNTPPPDDMWVYDSSMSSSTESEKQTKKDLPDLKKRMDEAGWPAEKKATFLDMLLGKKDS